jgi:hypothetical protein
VRTLRSSLFALIVTCGLMAIAFGQDPFISFDAPGAGTGAFQGTIPTCINRDGWIAGTIVDSANAYHGFLRSPDGTFTVFDIPGAKWTEVTAINNKGDVVGYTLSANSLRAHGFLRSLDGSYRKIQDPSFPKTELILPKAINDSGVVTGSIQYTRQAGPDAFVWSLQNGLVAFDAPDGVNTTTAAAINADGVITGTYSTNRRTLYHSFVRDAAGNITEFDFRLGTSTIATSINASGQIAGWIRDDNNFSVVLGMLRDPDGSISVISSPGLKTLYLLSISDTGVIVGYNDFGDSDSGVRRFLNGNLSRILLPFPNTSNQAVGVNNSGHMVGSYNDQNFAVHGWVQ